MRQVTIRLPLSAKIRSPKRVYVGSKLILPAEKLRSRRVCDERGSQISAEKHNHCAHNLPKLHSNPQHVFQTRTGIHLTVQSRDGEDLLKPQEKTPGSQFSPLLQSLGAQLPRDTVLTYAVLARFYGKSGTVSTQPPTPAPTTMTMTNPSTTPHSLGFPNVSQQFPPPTLARVWYLYTIHQPTAIQTVPIPSFQFPCRTSTANNPSRNEDEDEDEDGDGDGDCRRDI
ncbi:hypothetical protein HOY82DRAFT_539013 [Tuber indicum]|nr:hypothetical protein HOY82DRAFT_539013 [Tuber indicum]